MLGLHLPAHTLALRKAGLKTLKAEADEHRSGIIARGCHLARQSRHYAYVRLLALSGAMLIAVSQFSRLRRENS